MPSFHNSHYEKFLATGAVKCIDDEIPFEIPDGWEWCRLKTISIIQEGPGIRSFQYTTKGVQLLTVTNILEGTVDLQKSQKYISSEEYTNKYLHFQLNKGDIVCACSGGSWGKSAIFDLDNKQIILNTSTLRLSFYGDLGCNGFLYHITKSSFFKLQLAEQLSGMQPNFGYAHYSKILIPLPPIQEQIRIKSKINELLPPLSKYTYAQDKLDRLNASIKLSLKKSILQEAIQGKLVTQDPNDEPASVLLERIREEKLRLVKEGKLKKDITDSVIFKGDDNRHYEKIGNAVTCIENEIPFDIPNSWQWVRVKNLVQLNPKNEAENKIDAAFIPMEKISASYDSNYTFESAKWGTIKKGYTHFANGDVAFAKITPCFQNKKSVILEKLPNGIGAGTTELKVLRIYGETIDRWYLLYFLKSPQFIEAATFKGTANQQRIVNGYLEEKLFPLPPYNEQRRIVQKINELFAKL